MIFLHLFADEVCGVVPLEVEHGLGGSPVGQRGEGGRLQLRDVRVHVQGGGLLLHVNVILGVALDHLDG